METKHVATLVISAIVLIAAFVGAHLLKGRDLIPSDAGSRPNALRRRAEIVSSPSSFMRFTFEGRMGRKHYWFGLFLSHGVGRAFSDVTSWPWAQMLAAVGMLALLYGITLISRRLHDIGLSAWWQAPFVAVQMAVIALGLFMTEATSARLLASVDPELLGAITFIFLAAYLLFILAIGLIPGRKAPNAYGEQPPLTPLFPPAA